MINEILAGTGKASQRERLLPELALAVVYCMMALALGREAPQKEVRMRAAIAANCFLNGISRRQYRRSEPYWD